MLKLNVGVLDVIDLLNEALKLDSKAISDLIAYHAPCNESLGNHPTIQVAPEGVGMLGILNGLFGVSDRGWGSIAVVVEDDGTVVGFEETSDAKKEGWSEE